MLEIKDIYKTFNAGGKITGQIFQRILSIRKLSDV